VPVFDVEAGLEGVKGDFAATITELVTIARTPAPSVISIM
jgi:hypothetical protein